MGKQVFALIILFLIANHLPAQVCTNSGQTPATAILLCETDFYSRDNVPACGGQDIPVPCGGTVPYQNTNPYWFRIVCFGSGTLGITITPQDPFDDFNWQLFDVTGRNVNDVFTDANLFVAANWSSSQGATGTSSTAVNPFVCRESNQEPFSKMPALFGDREYLLMVSHRTNTETGFQLSLGGGTAIINDPRIPKILNARFSCDGSAVIVLMNKDMACPSIAADGSDFLLTGGANITAALAQNCNFSSETQVIALTLNTPVLSGNYTLSIKNGTDGNTIRDKCNRFIALGDITNVLPASMGSALPDTIATPTCSSAALKVVFKSPVRCNTIALNGSDFTITGPQAVIIDSISLECVISNPVSPTTSVIEVHFSAPITIPGIYQLVVKNGSDGDPVVGECGGVIPPGSSVPFVIRPPVSAAFNYELSTSCKQDTVRFFHDANSGVNNWNWRYNNSTFSVAPNPEKIFTLPGSHTIELIVSNGECRDTSTTEIVIDEYVSAAFDITSIICPEDSATFINQSTTADTWIWNFGNGAVSTLENPPAARYPLTGRETNYLVKLTAINSDNNCRDSIYKKVNVLSTCTIGVPTAFTPNGDGLNDFLFPLNALKADNLVFKVFNRFGQLIFETRDWTRKWDGKINGITQATGVYAWMLQFTYRDSGEKIFMNGTTVLIR